MSDVRNSENYLLDESMHFVEYIALKEVYRAYSSLRIMLSSLFKTDIDCINDQIELLKNVLTKSEKSVLGLEEYSVDDITGDLLKVSTINKELRALLSFMCIEEKAMFAVMLKDSYSHAINSDLDVNPLVVNSILDDMAKQLDDEAVKDIVRLSQWNLPVRMHKNRVLNYIEDCFERMVFDDISCFSVEDLALIRANLDDIIFPEKMLRRSKVLTDYIETILDASFVLDHRSSELEVSDVIQKLQMLAVNKLIVSSVYQLFEEFEFFIKAFLSLNLLEVDDDKLESFKELIGKIYEGEIDYKCELSRDMSYEALQDTLEEYDIRDDAFPTYAIISSFFDDGGTDVIYRTEIKSELFILSELYKSMGSVDKERYSLISKLLNLINVDTIVSNMSICSEPVSNDDKRAYIKNSLLDIENDLKSDTKMMRLGRINFIYGLKILTYPKDDYYEELMDEFDVLNETDKKLLVYMLMENFTNFKFTEDE